MCARQCHGAWGRTAPRTRNGDRETRERKPKACGGALHEPAPRERGEGAANVVFFTAHANDELFERGKRTTASETEEGAEDIDLEAHAVSLRSALNVRPLSGYDCLELP
jgi:hypothetical protein